MEKEIMCASILTAIILCVVGIIKVLPPCLSFKEKHPKWYRAIFYTMSLVFAIGLPFVAELWILEGSIVSINFFVLIITTIAGVFGLYGTYEGTPLKGLVKKLVSKVSELLNTYSDSKLAKVVGKVGIEKLTEIDVKIKADAEAKRIAEEQKLLEEQAKKEAENVVAEATPVVEANSTTQQATIAGQPTATVVTNVTPVNSVNPTNTNI